MNVSGGRPKSGLENKGPTIIRELGEDVDFHETLCETIDSKTKCGKWTKSLPIYFFYDGLWCGEGGKCANWMMDIYS